jgi:S1-C subfamily serine protease
VDRFGQRLLLITLAALLVAIVWQSVPALQYALLRPQAEPRVITPRGDLAADEQSTIALFEATKGSVVSISTAERFIDPWTRNAFDVPRGSGSGFIWDERGHIVTNHHVIEGASSALVRLADGRTFRASLVGSDPSHDLAVLLIGVGVGPSPLPIGTSADLRVGQKVFAIGNPFGLDWTLTSGIVSALERELPGLIQTDAAINPGHSGGPLIDSAGRLIGVNTAIYSTSGSYAGVGFAVPVDTVNRVVPQLIATGRYAPPTIGVSIDPRMDAVLERAGLAGILVLGVTPGSSAERAGIRPARTAPDGSLIPGDILVRFDGRELKTVADLLSALDERRAGEQVSLTIQRDGEEMDVRVTLDAGA